MKDTSNFILFTPKSKQETHLWSQTWELVIPRYMIYKNQKWSCSSNSSNYIKIKSCITFWLACNQNTIRCKVSPVFTPALLFVMVLLQTLSASSFELLSSVPYCAQKCINQQLSFMDKARAMKQWFVLSIRVNDNFIQLSPSFTLQLSFIHIIF